MRQRSAGDIFRGTLNIFISSAEVRVNQKTGCAPFTAGEQEQREVEGKKRVAVAVADCSTFGFIAPVVHPTHQTVMKLKNQWNWK